MRTDDLSVLAAHPYPFQLPFPDALLLANAWLRHPYLRGVLPSEIREPLKIALDSRNDGSFVTDGVYPTTPTDPGRRSLGSVHRVWEIRRSAVSKAGRFNRATARNF